jgi:hypothetical protein
VAHRLGRRFVLVEAAAEHHALIVARLERAGCGFTSLAL